MLLFILIVYLVHQTVQYEEVNKVSLYVNNYTVLKNNYTLECNEYSNSTVDVIQAIPLIPHTEPISISVVKCDFNGVPLIVGGSPASAGEFPFMVSTGDIVSSFIQLYNCVFHH